MGDRVDEDSTCESELHSEATHSEPEEALIQELVRASFVAISEPETPRQAECLRIYSFEEFINQPPVEYVVEGLIKPEDTVMIVGDAGAGKSFLALALMVQLAVGHGTFANAFEVRAPRTSLYMAGEGQSGLVSRLRALRSSYALSDCEIGRIFVSKELPTLFGKRDEPDGIDVLAQRMLERGIGALFIDTLSLAAHGSEENSSTDGNVVMRNVQALKALVPDLVVVLIHHANKGSLQPRGTTAYKASSDLIIGVKQVSEGARSLSCVKLKDGEPFGEIYFRLVPERSGTPSAVIEWIDSDRSSSGLSDLDKRVLCSLESFRERGLEQVATRTIAEELSVPSSSVDSSLKRLAGRNRIRAHAEKRPRTYSLKEPNEA